MKTNKTLFWVGLMLVLIGGVVAAYVMTQKFLSDRQSMMNDHPITREFRKFPSQGPIKRTYTQKDIEEAKKKGTLPPTFKQPSIPNTAAGDAAIQQSLKTIQEINRINEMNQKLIDQQQRRR